MNHFFFLNEEDGGRKWAMAGLDQAGRKHGGDLGFNLGFLEVGIMVGSDIHRSEIGKKVNMVLNIAGRR